MYLLYIFCEEGTFAVFFPPKDYEEQKPRDWTVSRNKLCQLFDKSIPQKSDGKERYISSVLMDWAWERDNKESGMVPYFPSFDHLAALRKRQNRAYENWAAKGCLGTVWTHS